MLYYLSSRKLDIESDNPMKVALNEVDGRSLGLKPGDLIEITWRDLVLVVSVQFATVSVDRGEIGFYTELWEKYEIPSGEMVSIEIAGQPHSIEYIRRKILGGRLNYEEFHELMDDIAHHRLSPVEITYFGAASYNPGFDDEELYNLTKAMAETGGKADFSHLGVPVVDKHSIGGVPSKGVTPLLVPIIASCGLAIPNTSTRAITSPAGTSDILECVLPVKQSLEQMQSVVSQTNGALVWGGGLDLAPADDVLIHVERPLHIESYDKFVVSIIAKKIPLGIQYLLIDFPFGENAKVSARSADMVMGKFRKVCEKFGINVDFYKRMPVGPDARGIGAVAEIKEVLLVLNQDPGRCIRLEDLALDMAGRLLELSGFCQTGKGIKIAREKLQSGAARDKFWEIAQAQGDITCETIDELRMGEETAEVKAAKSGRVTSIDNGRVVRVARALGAPFTKEAGMYFHKMPGDLVKEGDIIATLHAVSKGRLNLGKEEWVKEEIVEIQ